MRVVVVTGVSGAGKSRVGALLARDLGLPFQEGDQFHPAANIAKMKAGQPLDDDDRAPWLAQIARWIADHPAGGVVSCSALRRRYRDRLRQAGRPAFVLLDPPEPMLRERVAARRDHFMPPALLDSQLATLERPGPEEDVLTIAGDDPPESIVATVLRSFGYAWR